MGQCYSVEARFKFKNNDPSSFCQVIKDEIADKNGKYQQCRSVKERI